MRKELVQLQQIEDFLTGELKPEYVAEFERRIASDEDVQDEVFITNRVIEGIQASAFREMLRDIHSKMVAGKGSDDDSPK